MEEIIYSLESFVGNKVDVSGEDSISINDIVNYYSQIIPQKFMSVGIRDATKEKKGRAATKTRKPSPTITIIYFDFISLS